jgi:molybdopterin molybdotransferase
MKKFISFQEALDLINASVPTMDAENLPLHLLPGRVLAADVFSKVDSPSLHTSLKDGYAVVAQDLSLATNRQPVRLKVLGRVTAGDKTVYKVERGLSVKVLTGAPIPEGADAVLPEEFCRSENEDILCLDTTQAGRNVLEKGTDIRIGEKIAGKGEILSPPLLGLLASAGWSRASAYKTPRVSIIATGDEVLAPGQPLKKGKLYASNLVEISSWLTRWGIEYRVNIVPDSSEAIERAVLDDLPYVDAYVTSGGAWGSERDLVIKVLDHLKWDGIFHRSRMGPGKAVGFGLLEQKPFFSLPGGPPSNEMAFLQLALPAILSMAGHRGTLFPIVPASLEGAVKGQLEWTNFVPANVFMKQNEFWAKPIKQKSRLQGMAKKDAIIIIPEDSDGFLTGETILVQILETSFFSNLFPGTRC